MMVTNETRGTTLACKADIANTWLTRLKGLLGRKEPPTGGGLVLEPCNSVHTCFMRFPVDVLLVSADNKVVGIYEHMKPYKFTRIHREARRVIELPAGTLARTGTTFGDRIKLG